MEFISQIASFWNEFLMIGIGSMVLGCVLMGITTILAGKLKLISSIVVGIPCAICFGVAKVAYYIAICLGIIQLALILL